MSDPDIPSIAEVPEITWAAGGESHASILLDRIKDGVVTPDIEALIRAVIDQMEELRWQHRQDGNRLAELVDDLARARKVIGDIRGENPDKAEQFDLRQRAERAEEASVKLAEAACQLVRVRAAAAQVLSRPGETYPLIHLTRVLQEPVVSAES